MIHKIVNKPKILSRGDTCIVLSWDEVYSIENEKNEKIVYKLQIFDKNSGWGTIYWGPKTWKKIDDLGICTLYMFRICFIASDFNSEWLNFRAGTDCGPYLNMHMTRAIKIGNTSTIRKLTQIRPLLLELENKELKTPLMQVIEKNDIQMTHFLLNMGANCNTATLIGKKTPLMMSVYKGYLDIAQLLIEKGADLNATDINMLTPIHYAVDSNLLESVKFLVKTGCNVNVKDNKGWTPLHRTVILNNDIGIVDFLIKNGADTTIKDNNGLDYYKHCQLTDCNYLERLKEIENDDQEISVSIA